MSAETVDVIIVGCGPVGGITANYLGQDGVRTLIIDRELHAHTQPRAFSCDDETQRNFQAAGLANELAVNLYHCPKMDYIDGQRNVLASAIFKGLDFGFGHTALAFFSQPQLEGMLRQGLRRFPHVELRMGHEVDSFTQDADGVTVYMTERLTGRKRTVRARYLLGCDGAHSSIREMINVPMKGTSYGVPWITITATTPTPEPVYTYYVCDPQRPGFATRGAMNEIRMDLLLRGNERTEVVEKKEVVQRIIGAFMDPSLVTIVRAAVFTFHSKVAQRWRSGRVFLLGDAAHLMPPFLGQGMCSGVRDAVNLTWKLALAVKGVAGDELLDTYERERRPHAVNMINATVKMGRVFLSRSKFVAALRNKIMQWIWRNPKTQYLLRDWKVKQPIVLNQGFMAGGKHKAGLPGGTYFPQPTVGLAGGARVPLDSLFGNRFALLCMADTAEPVRRSAEALARDLGGVLLRVLPAARAGEARTGDVVDEGGYLSAWFSTHQADTVVVRPDRFVYGASLGDQIEKLREQVRAFIRPLPMESLEEVPAPSRMSSIA
ncbi:bifunctional 3-(3-hydroxy-phenyl)propionate/3-hydroxycinnamic acid hydroxylase [Stigmatella aurantiaca]|uniref:FAD-binding monooxygenase, PheA/TfdB family n=1 Tax=Stigmatella aurantiaca (strain DW4/3-1) TaxID=378806 RepID=Q09D29_STIAD|nr:bifunctional 3-(3-hydroxy-phenyl)propionate/3-hydroxycinnamic acid hydroxylase [Stigmatella aurantiaca]ADO67884.1 FAD-binding monooxygenase, PheA/TfdB family [Stigmatella aurantiaca DW4/3-1]EAU69640.1 putative polyketide hydroxylase [Stigmatella aurantiaca DW4/3-1]